MKPKTSKDVEIIKLRTRAMMNVLMKRIGCSNPNQFGAWINCESERFGWRDTQHSKKWYKLIDGEFTYPPVKPVHMLSQLFHDAEHIYNDGPANLWRSLWGNAVDPTVLWPLCRTRFDSNGPWFDEITWREIEAEFLNERTFRETIREFEGELLLAVAYGEPLTLNHLTEAVALYRLHQATNCLAVSDIDGVGAYRCIRHCLEEPSIFLELDSYNGFDLVRDELVEMEIGRLTAERSYLASIGIGRHQVALYADDPLSWIDTAVRWDAINLDWAPASPVVTISCAAKILESAGRNRPPLTRPSQAATINRDPSHEKVVHMQYWVRDR
jgi:hypothetical protein